LSSYLSSAASGIKRLSRQVLLLQCVQVTIDNLCIVATRSG
jgi:hypothetical protein